MVNDFDKEREGIAPEAGGSASEPAHMTDEELRAELEKQFRQQNVADVLMQFMVSLSTLAYVKMGITEDTREVKDLEQARMAIDSFKGMLDSVGDRLEQQNSEALAGALSSMQMTFVQVSEDQAAAGEEGASRLWVPGKE